MKKKTGNHKGEGKCTGCLCSDCHYKGCPAPCSAPWSCEAPITACEGYINDLSQGNTKAPKVKKDTRIPMAVYGAKTKFNSDAGLHKKDGLPSLIIEALIKFVLSLSRMDRQTLYLKLKGSL